MKKTMIALAMVCAFGLTATLTNPPAATAATGKSAAPTEDLVIKGKKPALFSHAKHTALGLDCGSCHHDAKHQPLNEAAIAGLPKTDLQCVSCHNPKFANAKLQKPMDVFHARCKTCHTDGINGKKGPTACAACHTPAAAAPAPAAAPTAAPAAEPKKKKAIEGC
jgi:hypothetical protein